MDVTLRKVVDGLPVAGLVADEAGCVLMSNRGARKLLGIEADGHPVASYFEGEAAERVAAVFDADSDARFTDAELVLHHANLAGGTPDDLRLRLRRLGESRSLRMLVVLETIDSAVELQRKIDDLRMQILGIRRLRHDANNDLMGLMGHAELLADMTEPRTALHRKADQVLERARSLRDRLRLMGETLHSS